MKNESFVFSLCFYKANLETELIIELMKRLMFFSPKSYGSDRKNFKRLGSKNFWEQLEINLQCKEKFYAEAKMVNSDPYISNWITLEYSAVTGIAAIRFDITNNDINILSIAERTVNEFAEKHHIISASIRSFSEWKWNDYSNLKYQIEAHPELPEIKVKYLGGVPSSADLEQFAGHTHLYEGLWFGCTYEMWYGPDYDRYIPLEKIASFDDCSEKEIFENGTVRIRMYDSFDDFSKPESVRRAWCFCQHTDCDAAADYWTEEINKLIVAQMEYQAEIEYGTFPHGGMCLIKSYLDENGKPITKSKAVKVHISERGTDGKSVFQETVEL